MSDQPHAPAALPRKRNTGTLFTGGWVGPGRSERVWIKDNLLSPPAFEARTLQSVASGYTNYANLNV